MPPEPLNPNVSKGSKVKATGKSEHPNLVGSAKDCTVPVTTEDVEEKGPSKLGVITTELISGNIGAGSVPALVVKGHKPASITFEITSSECCNSSKVPGVNSTSIFGMEGTKGVTVKVEVPCDEIFGLTTS